MGRNATSSSGRNRALRQAAAQIVALLKRAKTLGGFAHDRELRACPGCALAEDVTTEGRLIVGRARALGRDTRLRFRRPRDGRFRCPGCGAMLEVD